MSFQVFRQIQKGILHYLAMEYTLVVEYDSTSETTCNVKGLPATVQSNLENYFKAHNVICNNQKNCFEVDVEGIRVLNVLCESGFKVVTQSMAIDTTNIGGRSVKIQKIVWTLAKAL